MKNSNNAEMCWVPCYANPERGIAFFDGITIEADSITDPRWDRVLPVLEEEHVFECRTVTHLLEPGKLVLDAQTGSGVFAIWAAKRGCRVVALNGNRRSLRIAYANARRNGIEIVTGEADLREGTILLANEDFTKKLDDRSAVLSHHPNWRNGFDLMFLSPPYTPTCPEVLVALHAKAGEDGQDAFSTQIKLAPHFLKEGGWCVGNQMTLVSKEDQILALEEIRRAFGVSATIRHTRMIEPYPIRDCPVEDFLRSQYKSYLTVERDPGRREIEAYISRVGQRHAGKRFALIYYEAQRTAEHAQACVLEELELSQSVARSPATWQDRIRWHRHIVDHTSSYDSLPTPALLMRNAPISDLPVYSDRPSESLRKSINQYIKRSGVLEGEDPPLDILLVDSAPWYQLPAGYESLRQTIMAWLSRRAGTAPEVDNLLVQYQAAVRCMHTTHLGPFLHPYFVGAEEPRSWRGIQYTVFDKGEDIRQGLSKSESNLFGEMQSGLDGAYQELSASSDDVGRLKRILEQEGVRFQFEGNWGYSWTTLPSLKIEDLPAYSEAIWKRIERLQFMEQLPKGKAARRDLELAHRALHWRVDTFFQRIPTLAMGRWTAVIGLPLFLSLRFQESSDPQTIPKTYRGGIWVFASSYDRWTKSHEEWLFDLTKYLWLLYASNYNYGAIEGLAGIEVEQLSSDFGHQVKQVSQALSARWLIKPTEALRRLANSEDARLEAANERWQIVPFPELLRSAGLTMSLWCRLNRPTDFFDVSRNQLPKTMEELVRQCWQAVKDRLKAPLCRGTYLNSADEILAVQELQRKIDALWGEGNLFNVKIAETVPNPPPRDTQQDSWENWMVLVRLITVCFENCVQHGHPGKEVKVTITCADDLLRIAIENDSDVDDNGLDNLINDVRGSMSSHEWAGHYGSELIMRLARRLDGRAVLKKREDGHFVCLIKLKRDVFGGA
jgi:methylase of polypeptide subunit release factors